MVNGQKVVAEVKRLFAGRLEEIENRLSVVEETSLEEIGEEAARAESPIPPGIAANRVTLGLEIPVTEKRRDLVVAGTEGLRKIRQGREDDITAAEQMGLEAIIVLEGRPAVFIQNDDIVGVPTDWQVLAEQRDAIRASITRVGRIEVSGHPDFAWLGTGFLVGAEAIMTNRHVASEFAMRSDGGWSFRPGMSSQVDFKEEFGSLQPLEFRITDIIGIHEKHDMALLRCEPRSGSAELPEPLSVSALEPDPLPDRTVYVIGYPAWDGRRNDPRHMQQIFTDIFDVKRLQPGEIRSFEDAIPQVIHDCSTLGGNSGSPVFDLESHRVVGLHFGGRYLEGNRAVPLWRLLEDELLVKAGVNFL
jgi:hypothetical protein